MADFNFDSPAELFPGRGRRHGVSYKRFETAADALRFAIEELDAKLLFGAVLEVDEERFNEAEMRDLYARAEYPLARRNAQSPSPAVHVPAQGEI